ncbi:MAG: carbohydrate binding family 9 domain-containing protein [Rhodothermales bacterium]|nr:carbohydrate binding family 9 domain-containing protein [Rhodothermales bacterium]MBO6781325.1 carbohydrate binding family 9 domain-containing protein [Rhodothermales bacterium]
MRCLTLALLLSLTVSASAQTQDEASRPVYSAVFMEGTPVLDGHVLADPFWDAVGGSDDFWQTQPSAGSPASERTEVRIAYTADTLYVGAILFDSQPSAVIATDARRDASLDDTDSFRFILDTYRDGQNGFVFGTSPAGLEFDAQVSREGQGGFGNARQQGGSGAGVNVNWDGSWRVRTAVDENGWSAEFAIPFRTLRYSSDTEQVWGFNAQRNIRRRNERAFWSPLPRAWNLYRVSVAGSLEGLRVPSLRNLTFTPYTLGQVQRDYTGPQTVTSEDADFGADLKYGITPSLTLDATYNTDFAQVEVDEQQVNLDRFSLFFPEKRPFFLENAGLFAVGEPSEVELFFSRRIGIQNGVAVPIVGGLRLSGQTGDTRVGLLNMQTGSSDGQFVANNFTVGRVQRELPNRSSFGALITNREGTGDLAPANDYNRLAAVDGRLGLGQYGMLQGFVARTVSPGDDSDPWGLNVEANYQDDVWRLIAAYTRVGEGFNPEVGFLRRSAYHKTTLLLFRAIRPDNFLGLLEMRPHISYRGFWGLDGFHETGFLHVDSHWEWPTGHEVHTGINFTREGVRQAFEIQDGFVVPPDTYDHREAMIIAWTDQSRPISLNTRTIAGGFFGGDRVSFNPSLRVRRGDALTAEFGLSYNRIDLPSGSFTTNLYRSRLSYSFTPRLYLQSLIQYSDQAGVWSANLRLGWLQEANTGLFIVINQTSDLDGALDEALQRGITVKYSRLIDVL